MNKKDYMLMFVLCSSLICGIIFPTASEKMAWTIKYLLMALLFLSFIKISPGDVKAALITNRVHLARGILLRLCIAPLIAYALTRILYPAMALPMLLVAGVSTGVTAPFFIGLFRGNISYGLVMTIVTNLLLPFSLPFMVNLLAQSDIKMDLMSMALFLLVIIIIPLALAFLLRMVSKPLLNRINEASYPFSLVIIFATNFGALGAHVPYLAANPGQIITCAGFALLLGILHGSLGWFTETRKTWTEKMASAGSHIWLNNVVVIALSIQINEPLAALLSIFYFFPMYSYVALFSWYQASKKLGFPR